MAWGRGAARDGHSFLLGDETLLLLSLNTLHFCASLLFQILARILRPNSTYDAAENRKTDSESKPTLTDHRIRLATTDHLPLIPL